MQDKKKITKALKIWSFTAKDLADFVGVKIVTVRRIKAGSLNGSPETQAKIALFLKQKIKEINDILE